LLAKTSGPSRGAVTTAGTVWSGAARVEVVLIEENERLTAGNQPSKPQADRRRDGRLGSGPGSSRLEIRMKRHGSPSCHRPWTEHRCPGTAGQVGRTITLDRPTGPAAESTPAWPQPFDRSGAGCYTKCMRVTPAMKTLTLKVPLSLEARLR